jgi:uncharacterized protein YndB with AHSA1/START domain
MSTTIHHRISIHAPAATVYAAIATASGIGTWWDAQTPVHTDRGLVLEHHPGPEHGVVRLRVVELVPNRRVEWECISAHPPSSPASAWTGTHFIFEIEAGGETAAPSGATRQSVATTVDFRQTGYDEGSRFFQSNSAAWEQVLDNLKRVVESGSGGSDR